MALKSAEARIHLANGESDHYEGAVLAVQEDGSGKTHSINLARLVEDQIELHGYAVLGHRYPVLDATDD